MTDKVKGFTVTLDKDYRDDDVQVIADAISMIKGVIHVENSITTVTDHLNRQVIKTELITKLFKTLHEE